jgi:gluconate 2-dehydrogenase gamma chain
MAQEHITTDLDSKEANLSSLRGSGTIPGHLTCPNARLLSNEVMKMGNRSEAPQKTPLGLVRLPSVSRRDLLAGTAATIACAVLPVSSLRFARTTAPTEVLTSVDRQSLEAMVSRIIPAGGDGPGALEAGCVRYIESALGDAYQSLRKTYSEGLAALNSYAMSHGGKAFAALGAAAQDKILSDFEKNDCVGDYSDSAAFFDIVRRHTLEGMFGDPSYGGNANFAGWDLISYPGPRIYVTPEMERMDAKLSHSRVSAEQLMHGSH